MAVKKATTKEDLTSPADETASTESAKAVSLTSPWGASITVAADLADSFKDVGYKASK